MVNAFEYMVLDGLKYIWWLPLLPNAAAAAEQDHEHEQEQEQEQEKKENSVLSLTTFFVLTREINNSGRKTKTANQSHRSC